MTSFEDYLNNIDFYELLEELDPSYVEIIINQVKYFSEKEAERRDQIVLSYFGENGIERVTESIVKYLLMPPRLTDHARILDVGAGSGFFTVRIADEVLHCLPEASFYAMDITPAMLHALVRKSNKIVPFIGVVENISRSIQYASKYISLPREFDAIFSVLTLHHCLDVQKVFKSIRNALADHGKAIIVDLCEHPFEEFRDEMGDIHLGFNPSFIKSYAEKIFPSVSIEKIRGIRCECSDRAAELFIMYLTCK